MDNHIYTERITCAYLYPITRYGYPPDIRQTTDHISEMAAMGFRSIELEGIGEENILYLQKHQTQIADTLANAGCKVPILCIVLPALSGTDVSKTKRSLELFETGCAVAKYLGATAVLDNGPLLPMKQPDAAPIQRHYHSDQSVPYLPSGLSWEKYWGELVTAYQQACSIAASFHLSYHMHPCEGSLITGTESFINFSRAVNSSNLLFNLDTANQFYFRDNLPLSVLRLADKIDYIHISDNRGQRVEHLVPGAGNIQWDDFFKTLQQINFKGQFAIDIGGAETNIPDITKAYLRCADWLEQQLESYPLNN